MNTLAMIKRQIEKAESRRRAQLSHTAYRGKPVTYNWQRKEPHGDFTYRGVKYTK